MHLRTPFTIYCTSTLYTIHLTLYTIHHPIRLAVDAAVTVLKVDQIVMSKPAGGPKPRQGPNDPDDD
ncbi:hypothetical protein EON63_01400 [archaeon]|nr:MAG: hypothetical protein EON63_01400 [archaeon]